MTDAQLRTALLKVLRDYSPDLCLPDLAKALQVHDKNVARLLSSLVGDKYSRLPRAALRDLKLALQEPTPQAVLEAEALLTERHGLRRSTVAGERYRLGVKYAQGAHTKRPRMKEA